MMMLTEDKNSVDKCIKKRPQFYTEDV